MQQLAIRHPKLMVWIKTGSEGPRHDPYAFSEVTVQTPNGETILHEGLGTWLKFNGQEFPTERFTGDSGSYERHLRDVLFPRCVGYSTVQLERIIRRRQSRCGVCGSKHLSEQSGYPGETLTICDDCDHINDSRVDLSALE